MERPPSARNDRNPVLRSRPTPTHRACAAFRQASGPSRAAWLAAARAANRHGDHGGRSASENFSADHPRWSIPQPIAVAAGRQPQPIVCWNRDPTPVYISRAMAAKPTLYGRELSDAELEAIRAQVESFDSIERIYDDMRELIATQWPQPKRTV